MIKKTITVIACILAAVLIIGGVVSLAGYIEREKNVIPDGYYLYDVAESSSSLSKKSAYMLEEQYSQSGQDGAILGDYLFRCNSAGNVSIYELESGLFVQSMQLDKTDILAPHCNSVSFYNGYGKTYLYANVYNNYASAEDKHIGECLVYDVDNSGTSLKSWVFTSGMTLMSADGSYREGEFRSATEEYRMINWLGTTFTVTGAKFIVSLYDSDYAYLGQYNPSSAELIIGSGQWLNSDTVITTSALSALGGSYVRLVIDSPTVIPVMTIDGETVNTTENGISAYTNTLAQVIKIGFINNAELWAPSSESRPYGNFIVDSENDCLYAWVMYSNKKATYWYKFDLPDQSEGVTDEIYGCPVLTLTEDDIKDSWTTEFSYYLQGAAVIDGKIWSTEGFSSTTLNVPRIRVIDPATHTEVATFQLWQDGWAIEPEFIDVHNGQIYYGSASTLYKLNLI